MCTGNPHSRSCPGETELVKQACTTTGKTWSSPTSQLTRSARPLPRGLSLFSPLPLTVLVLVERGLRQRGGAGGWRNTSSGCRERAWGKLNRTCADSAFVLHSNLPRTLTGHVFLATDPSSLYRYLPLTHTFLCLSHLRWSQSKSLASKTAGLGQETAVVGFKPVAPTLATDVSAPTAAAAFN